MFVLEADLVGEAPLGFGKVFESPKKSGEKPDDYEERCWRERIHTDKDGNAFVPDSALKKMIEHMAKYLGEKIPGKGQATYSKNFRAGIMLVDHATVVDPKTDDPIKSASVPFERIHVPADGKVGGTKRVYKNFPYIPDWKLHLKVYVNDPVIGKDLLVRYLKTAGKFGGIGRYRPSSDSGGYYGRFRVENVDTVENPDVE